MLCLDGHTEAAEASCSRMSPQTSTTLQHLPGLGCMAPGPSP